MKYDLITVRVSERSDVPVAPTVALLFGVNNMTLSCRKESVMRKCSHRLYTG